MGSGKYYVTTEPWLLLMDPPLISFSISTWALLFYECCHSFINVWYLSLNQASESDIVVCEVMPKWYETETESWGLPMTMSIE